MTIGSKVILCDPVIQIRNADGIYNGEVGVIQEAEMNRIQVRFTGSDKDRKSVV